MITQTKMKRDNSTLSE